MRRGTNPSFVTLEDGSVIGVELGSDFCSEHEHGILKLQRALSVPLRYTGEFGPREWPDTVARKPKNLLEKVASLFGASFEESIDEYFGVTKGRTITRVDSDCLMFAEGSTHSRLIFDSRLCLSGYERNPFRYNIQGDPEDLAASWDESSFGIVVSNKHLTFLRELFEAFKRLDVAIFLGRGATVLSTGFFILISSKCPKDIDENFKKCDASSYKLQKAVKASGIREKLKEAGCEYFALSPKWKDGKEEEITYWLNPYDQRGNNYGHFSEADLLDWTVGKGKIPMTKEQKEKEFSRK
ncbi:MAG: hypothetical protein HY225_00245 [Candidatus Vogelbacteria bacterium]|nr:hypothetical protein [Candidatus Vogelbacteria bacterium]